MEIEKHCQLMRKEKRNDKSFYAFTLRDGAKSAPPQGERPEFLSWTEKILILTSVN
jgi:hypothetical protein